MSFVLLLESSGTSQGGGKNPGICCKAGGGQGWGKAELPREKQRQAREASLTVKEPVGKGTSAGECRNKLHVYLTFQEETSAYIIYCISSQKHMARKSQIFIEDLQLFS